MKVERKLSFYIMRFVTYSFLFYMLIKSASIVYDTAFTEENSENEISIKKIETCNIDPVIYYIFALCSGAVMNNIDNLKLGVI